MKKKIFVNIAVADLPKSIEFFTKLGYTFNPRYTDDTATCMEISEEIFVMLLTHDKMKMFTKKKLADAHTSTEALIGITADSKHAVDELVDKALAAGGKVAREPEDLEFMYTRSYEDLDGHIWEIFWLNEDYSPEKGV